MTLATRWARTFLRGLEAAGVDRVFVSPGSRSTPLALAATETLPTTVVADERSAAFAAIGHARVTGRPAALIATSGSAPAHWFAAIIEADEARIPLVAISADRPLELQASGAPQTVDQVSMFGAHVRRSIELGAPDERALDALQTVAMRAVFSATASNPGPVHVNARFRKPLEPAHEEEPAPAGRVSRVFAASMSPSAGAVEYVRAALERAQRPVLVAGPMPYGTGGARREYQRALRAAVDAVRERLGIFVAAESTSGLVSSDRSSVVPLAPALMARMFEGTARPDLVLELGHAAVTGAYARFAASGAERISVSATVAQDPHGGASAFVVSEPLAFLEALARLPASSCRYADRAARAWHVARSALSRSFEHKPEGDDAPLDEPSVAWVLARSMKRGALLAGNSLSVRDFEAFGAFELGAEVTMLHQRGASGIDGLLAGAAGARLAVDPSLPVGLVYGDVSALHDVGSFALLADPRIAKRGPLAVVVVDNGGGRIFEGLPMRDVLASDARFDELYLTAPPPGFVRGVAAAFGVEYTAVRHVGALATALERALSSSGPVIIEASADPDRSRAARTRLETEIALSPEVWS